MIKKILLSLGLIGLGVINFSNSAVLCPVALNGTSLYTFNLNEEKLINDRQSNSNFILKSNFNFLIDNSNYNGKFFFSNNPWTNSYSLQTYLFWAEDGLYYAYGGSSSSSDFSSNVIRQGYINYFCKVDSIDGFCKFNVVNSCSSVQGYSLVSSGDVYFNSDYSNPDIMKVFATSSTMVNFCFIYTDLGFTLCAPVGTSPICDSNNDCVVYYSNLLTPTNTINPTSIDTSVMVSSPFGSSGGSDGGIGTGISLECTKQNALNWYNKNGYTKNLCYGGLSTFEVYTGSPLGYFDGYGTGYDFEEIRLQTSNLRAYGQTGTSLSLTGRLYYWDSQWTFYRNGDGLYGNNNPFLNTPFVLMTYIGAVNTYGSNFDKSSIIEYCDLLLYTSDYSVGYSGLNMDKVCTRSNLLDDYNFNLSGNNLNIGVNINGSGENITDGTDFINKYWAVLSENFSNAVENTDGVIPLYIQLALIGLILFRFISH